MNLGKKSANYILLIAQKYTNCKFHIQGSPHLLKTGRHDFSLAWLGDFRKASKILTFLSPLPHVPLPFTKQNCCTTILKYWSKSMIIGEKYQLCHLAILMKQGRKSTHFSWFWWALHIWKIPAQQSQWQYNISLWFTDVRAVFSDRNILL